MITSPALPPARQDATGFSMAAEHIDPALTQLPARLRLKTPDFVVVDD